MLLEDVVDADEDVDGDPDRDADEGATGSVDSKRDAAGDAGRDGDGRGDADRRRMRSFLVARQGGQGGTRYAFRKHMLRRGSTTNPPNI